MTVSRLNRPTYYNTNRVLGAAPQAPAAISGGTSTTYTSGTVSYAVCTFTASGTLTVSSHGLVDVLLLGGGGAGG